MTTAPEGRRLLRIEARNAEVPIERKPEWIKTRAVMGPEYTAMKQRVHGQGLHTVCEEAGCPNIFECWEDQRATFLIGGDTCTRRCDFCNIATGKPMAVDPMEPFKVAQSVKEMGLRYSTITGVARDDLEDGAAGLRPTCEQIHSMNPGTGVELLIDDIKGNGEHLEQVFEAKPEVFAHNLETVPRIFKQIRPAFRYERSLDVISMGRAAGMITKSNLILGMGETDDEILESLQRLRDAGCDIITITQYMRLQAASPDRPLGQAPAVRRLQEDGGRTSASSACWPDRSCARRTERGCYIDRRWKCAAALRLPSRCLPGWAQTCGRALAVSATDGAAEALTHGFCLCSCISRYIVFL